MKRVFIISIAVLLTALAWTQSPEKISYQAVIRDAENALVINQTVGMRISILQGSVTGMAIYVEIHAPVTNAYGMINLEIGSGTIISGDFSDISWAKGPYFLRTEVDLTGGVNYIITGTSQLLSVPYALHAKTAEALSSDINETDPVFGASPAASITQVDITKMSDLSGVNTGDQDLSALASKAALGDSVALIRSEIPDISGFITSETQDLADVASKGNSVNTQLKNVTDPTDPQDAATKAYVDELKKQIMELQIETGIKIQDIDGNIYNTITIGSQVWMLENLKTTRYNDGTPIPLVTDNTEWSILTTSGYCWYNNDESTYGDIYGALYNWYTIENPNLCPTGWHVPTHQEWMTLTNDLGGEKISGGKLKEEGTVHWNNPNTDATNETGFTAVPGGNRNDLGEFSYIGFNGYWWTSSQLGGIYAWPRFMNYDNGEVGRFPNNKKKGFSVRCMKD